MNYPIEQLALIYLQGIDCTNMTPSDFFDKYLEIYEDIHKRFSEAKNAGFKDL
jgi:hypothetical protein